MNEIREQFKNETGVDIDMVLDNINGSFNFPLLKAYIDYIENIINQKKIEHHKRINRLIQGNFIMRIRHLASVQELDDWDEKYKAFVESIPPDRYSEFLSLYENDGLKRVMDVWL
jgi:hypothetical protein